MSKQWTRTPSRTKFCVPCRVFAGASPALLCAALALGQAPATTGEEALSPQARQLLLQPSTDGEAYRLGRGDVLSVSVQGRPELTGKQIVGPDGSITLPIVGSVSVADLTRDEAASLLREKLLRYYTDPSVTVGVDTYTSNQILLVGAVERPGPQLYERQPTLLDVLGRGGVLRSANVGNQFNGTTGGNRALPDRAIIYRGTQTAINVDVASLARGGNMLANVRLLRGDVVYVPANEDLYISILGQVQRPGAQPLERETTLARLLSNAGGLTQSAGHNPTLRLVEPSTGTVKLVNFKDLLKASATDIPLHSGDILYVPESAFNSATYVLDRLSPLVNIFTAAAFLNTR